MVRYKVEQTKNGLFTIYKLDELGKRVRNFGILHSMDQVKEVIDKDVKTSKELEVVYVHNFDKNGNEIK